MPRRLPSRLRKKQRFARAPIRELGPQDGLCARPGARHHRRIQRLYRRLSRRSDGQRVRVIVAARREAITWRRTCAVNTPPAYWSYLRRYPDGPHSGDAHRRLAFLAAALEPPPRFAMLAYDLPPPPPEEIVYIRRPVLVFDDPCVRLCTAAARADSSSLRLRRPNSWCSPRRRLRSGFSCCRCRHTGRCRSGCARRDMWPPPPANNVIYNNVHNTVVVNNVTNTVTVTNRSGQTSTLAPPVAAAPAPGAGGAAAAAAPAAAIGPSLPPSVAKKAVTLQNPTPPAGAGATPAGLAPAKPAPGQALPGTQGQPLPAVATPGTVTPASQHQASQYPAKQHLVRQHLRQHTLWRHNTWRTNTWRTSTWHGITWHRNAWRCGAGNRQAWKARCTARRDGLSFGGSNSGASATPPYGGATPATGSPTPPSAVAPKPTTSPRTPAAKLTPPSGSPPPPAGNSAPPQLQAPAAKLAPPPPPAPPKPVAPPPARVVTPPPRPRRHRSLRLWLRHRLRRPQWQGLRHRRRRRKAARPGRLPRW